MTKDNKGTRRKPFLQCWYNYLKARKATTHNDIKAEPSYGVYSSVEGMTQDLHIVDLHRTTIGTADVKYTFPENVKYFCVINRDVESNAKLYISLAEAVSDADSVYVRGRYNCFFAPLNEVLNNSRTISIHMNIAATQQNNVLIAGFADRASFHKFINDACWRYYNE